MAKIKEIWNDISKELREQYKLTAPALFDEDLNMARELVQVQILMEEMEDNGATADELMDVLKYMIIVDEADRERLDWKRAYNDFKIDDYVDKYFNTNQLQSQIKQTS